MKRKKVKNLGALGLEDPLAVIPSAEPDVEAKADEKNLLQLRRRYAPKGRLYGWLARKLNYAHETRVNLDERGTLFWRQMDGARTLDGISASLATEFGLTASDAKAACVMFAKVLMTRRLIYLAVPSERK